MTAKNLLKRTSSRVGRSTDKINSPHQQQSKILYAASAAWMWLTFEPESASRQPSKISQPRNKFRYQEIQVRINVTTCCCHLKSGFWRWLAIALAVHRCRLSRRLSDARELRGDNLPFYEYNIGPHTPLKLSEKARGGKKADNNNVCGLWRNKSKCFNPQLQRQL